MKIKFGQHIYGRKKEKGFSTLGYSPDVSIEDLRLIEKNCIYELPTSMYYNEGIEEPVKYVFWKLNEEKVVIGRGVYIGKDEFGRVGNYLFHNLIFQTKDLTDFEINPVSLIRYLGKKGIFALEPLLDEKLECLEVSIDENNLTIPSNFQILPQTITDILPDLIYLCFDPKTIDPIVVEYNEENKIFNFLEGLFLIIPKGRWKELSFNTLWYKDYGFLLCGIKKRFSLHCNFSAKIDLEKNLSELKLLIKDNALYEYAKLAAQKVLEDKEGLSILYSLQELVEAGNWNRFIEVYRDAPQDIKSVIYENNKENILTEVSNGNINLFSILKENLSKEDLNRVFKSKMIDHLLETRDEIIKRNFIEWFYEIPIREDKRNFYQVFLSNVWLLDLFLNKIKQEKFKNIEIVQDLLQEIYIQYAKQKKYDEVIEEKVLEIFCELLENNPDIDTYKTLKVVKKLPPSDNPKILLLRALIMYKLEDSSEIIFLIKEEKYQSLIYELLKKGMKTIDWKKYKIVPSKKESKLFITRLFK